MGYGGVGKAQVSFVSRLTFGCPRGFFAGCSGSASSRSIGSTFCAFVAALAFGCFVGFGGNFVAAAFDDLGPLGLGPAAGGAATCTFGAALVFAGGSMSEPGVDCRANDCLEQGGLTGRRPIINVNAYGAGGPLELIMLS